MGVKVKSKGKFDMQKRAREINGKTIEVGVFGGEHEELAAIHEYGCQIKVSYKMRLFLEARGMEHIPGTIVIPERSFIRAGFDKEYPGVRKRASSTIAKCMCGLTTADAAVEAIGEDLASKIKIFARDLKSPPNHPFTIAQKGKKSSPLVDSGDMIGSIKHQIKG